MYLFLERLYRYIQIFCVLSMILNCNWWWGSSSCPLGNVESHNWCHLLPGPFWRRVIKTVISGFNKSLWKGFVLNRNIWELIFFKNFIFIYCRLFVLILVVFVLFLLSLCFSQISPLAFFRWFITTSDRNAEFCNRIPSNYCLP